jgi:hypothetical protein
MPHPCPDPAHADLPVPTLPIRTLHPVRSFVHSIRSFVRIGPGDPLQAGPGDPDGSRDRVDPPSGPATALRPFR